MGPLNDQTKALIKEMKKQLIKTFTYSFALSDESEILQSVSATQVGGEDSLVFSGGTEVSEDFFFNCLQSLGN